MKNLFIISLILISSSAMSSTPLCEIKNDDYNIDLVYNRKLEKISYVITKKNNTNITYLDGSYTIGFKIKDLNFNKISLDKNNINHRYSYMIGGNEDYFSESMNGSGSQMIHLPFSNNVFKQEIVIKNEINLIDFTKVFREFQESHNDRLSQLRSYKESDRVDLLPFSNQILIPQIKIILDPEIKTCIDYSGKPFEYNFGNRYYYQFNVWWPKFKERTNQTWKAIIE